MSISASEMMWSCFLFSELSVKMQGVWMKNFSVSCGLANLSSSRS